MNQYLHQLTWLRGLAAFFVICGHSLRALDPVYHNESVISQAHPFRFLDLGTFGVLLFFVLSGCTLTISNGLNFNTKNHIAIFMVKRFFRIWPAFFLSILLYAIFRLVFQEFYVDQQGFWVEYQFMAQVDWYDFLTYITLIFNYTGNNGLFNNAFWSLPVEFQYYILFPMILMSYRYLSIFGPILIGGILYFLPQIVALPAGIDKKFFVLAYSFCAGVLIGGIYLQYKIKFRISQTISFILIFMTLMLNALVVNDLIIIPDVLFISNKWNFNAISAIFLTGLLLLTEYNIHPAIAAILKKMGDISYSSYLLHNMVIATVMLIIIQLDLYDIEYIVLPIISIIFTYALSHYFHKYVEVPGINFGRYLSKKLNK